MLSVVMVRTVVIPSEAKEQRDKILYHYFYANKPTNLGTWRGRGNKVYNISNHL